MNDLIRIDQLTHRFGSITALDKVSLSFKKGIITGLVGPDGAGKTTLLRLMAGLMTPSAGNIQFDQDFSPKDSAQFYQQIGYMPQKFGLYEDLTILENLQLYADLKEVPKQAQAQQFDQLLTMVNMVPFKDRLSGNLSGGMKQKLALCCSLLGSPRLLLLDEPCVGVDPISRQDFWAMVETLLTEGISVIWSTSYLDEAERCQEICLLNEGKLLFNGPPAALTKQIENQTFLLKNIPANARRNLLQKALSLPETIDGTVFGQYIRLVLQKNAPFPTEAGLNYTGQFSWEPVSPWLEDAFISLLGGVGSGESLLAQKMPDVILDEHEKTEAVIEANALTRCFGNFTAADHISFQIRQGEIFGLLGPNGAGKSTTFKMMCGLLRPTSGDAHVIGIDLKKSASKARAQIGYMAQKFALYSMLSVEQNLSFFSGIYGLKGEKQKQSMAEMVQTFGLTPYLQYPAGDLPLGFKQRLALACALMHQPKILFLDEPTSGVDPITRREFWTHINGLVQKGVTVMVTTHFMDEAEYCDRIALIYRGKMIAMGSPDHLKAQVPPKPEGQETTMEDAFIHLIKEDDKKRQAS